MKRIIKNMMVEVISIAIIVLAFTVIAYANVKYSVTFNGNGVSFNDNASAKAVELEANELYNRAALMAGDLYKDGEAKKKAFLGWSTEPNSKEPINLWNYTLAEDVTFYAVWEDVVYITWDGNGVPLYDVNKSYSKDGEWVKGYSDYIVKAVPKGKPISSIPNQDPDPEYSSFDPEKDKRKILRGWSNDGTENNMFIIYSSEPRPIVNEDVTYKAVWYDAAFITWDGNGGKIKGDYTTDNQKVLSIDGDKKTWKYPIGTYLNYMWRQRDFESVPANKVLKGWSLDGTEKTMVEFHDAETLKKYGMDYVLFGTKYLIKDDVTFIAVWGDPDVQEELESETEKTINDPAVPSATPSTTKPVETPVVDRNETISSGGGGGSLPQAQDPAPTTTPSETVEQPTTTGAPTITQDAFTGISETIAPSTDGTASVTSVSGTVGKTLRITGTVNQGGTNYPVSSFATNAFSNVDVKNIFIDLKTSGNTQTVTFQPRTFKGSEAKKLTLRLSSSGQVKFSSGAMSGSKIKKVVVSGLKKKEFKRVEKKLRKSGYKGKIVKK